MASDAAKYILLIDDDASLTRQWRIALEARGYEVNTCHTVAHGMTACEQRWPDAIVVDAFFRDKEGKPTGSGGMLFCTQLSIHAYDNKLELPHVIGVTGSRPSKHFPVDVFGQVSQEVMPLRLRKPFSAHLLADAIDRAFT